MRMFRGRPLAVAGSVVLLAAMVGYFFVLPVKILIISLLSVLFAVFFVRAVRVRKSRYCSVCALLVLFLAIVMTVRTVFYWDVSFAKAREVCGSGRTVCGTVSHTQKAEGYYSSYRVRITSVDGEKCDIPASLFCSYACDLQSGYSFELTGADVALVTAENDEYTDYELAEGLRLSLTSEDPESLRITGEGKPPLSERISYINTSLSARFVQFLGKERGGLCAAMLLRCKKYLDPSVRRDFTRSGISHLLAVSGLHLTILTTLIGAALSRLRLPRTAVSLLTLAFALAYLTVLGFPVSAVRSFVMLCVVLGLRLYGVDADGVSSLGLALCVILPFSPAAFLDLGFVMSFCATLGLVAIMQDTPGKKKSESEGFFARLSCFFGERVFPAVLTVLCAHLFTLLPLMRSGGSVSLAAIPVNLIAVPVASALLLAALLFLPLSFVPVLSGFFAFIPGKFAGLLISLAGFFSRMEGVSFSLSQRFVPYIVIPATLITGILLIIKLKRKIIIFAPFTAAVIAFAVCAGVTSHNPTVDLIFLSEKGSESTVITGQGRTVIMDMTDGSSSRLDLAVNLAMDNGADEIDALILTHYHLAHEGTVEKLLRSQRVRRLWLPEPVSENDAEVMLRLFAASQDERSACECLIYHPGDELNLYGDVTVRFSGIAPSDRSTHPVFAFSLSYGTENVTYVSSSAWDSSLVLADFVTPDTDILLFGAHGPIVRNAPDALPAPGKTVFLGRDIPESFFVPSSGAAAILGKSETVAGAQRFRLAFGGG